MVGTERKYIYTDYKEYLKSKNITNILCDDIIDPRIDKLKNIKTYPNSKQFVEFINCKKS